MLPRLCMWATPLAPVRFLAQLGSYKGDGYFVYSLLLDKQSFLDPDPYGSDKESLFSNIKQTYWE